MKNLENEERLKIIKDAVRMSNKKHAESRKHLKNKISDIAAKTLKLSNENFRLKQELTESKYALSAKNEQLDRLSDDVEENFRLKEELTESKYALSGKNEQLDRLSGDVEIMRNVIYSMYEQIQLMYSATVLPDMFLPGGKVIFPKEIMEIQASWFYFLNEELSHVIDHKRVGNAGNIEGNKIDDQII